jgi:hypothetical protein
MKCVWCTSEDDVVCWRRHPKREKSEEGEWQSHPGPSDETTRGSAKTIVEPDITPALCGKLLVLHQSTPSMTES